MASIFRKFGIAGCLLLMFSTCYSFVHQVTKKSIYKKFISQRHFTLTFVDSPSCSRCRILYPFYVIASQSFPNDPDIFFTRTHDKLLISEWGVKTLPALVYHIQDDEEPSFFTDDITVDDILDQIQRRLMGNFAGLTPHYSLHVDAKIYDELVMTPQQSVMMLIHRKGDKEEIKTMEQVAYVYRKETQMLFVLLDVGKHEKLRDERFKTKDTPVVMWLEEGRKDTARQFGGMMTPYVFCQFINERTGLDRHEDGALKPEAGRLKEADEIIDENMLNILEGDDDALETVITELNDLRPKYKGLRKEMLDYYLYIIDKTAMATGKGPYQQMLTSVENKLFGEEEFSTRTVELLKRQKNILTYFRDLENFYSEEKKKKSRVELKKLMEKKKEKREKEVVVNLSKIKTLHAHEEL